jgi:cyclophilin family peptidyl-prolyl cis-trans isomerase
MKLSNFSYILLFLLIFSTSCSCLLKKPYCVKNYAKIETNHGLFFIGLYEGTPLHRDNFMSNCKNYVYDSVQVYRMTTAGTVSFGMNDNIKEKNFLSENYPDKVIEPEFNEELFHKKYAVGMTRLNDTDNPELKSDPRLFYVVIGMKLNDKLLNSLIARENADIINEFSDKFLDLPENTVIKDSLNLLANEGRTEEWQNLRAHIYVKVSEMMTKNNVEVFDINDHKRDVYIEMGGIPVYDKKYTVFGEITYGYDVVDKISEIRTDIHRRPLTKVHILSAEILKKREYKREIRKNNK